MTPEWAVEISKLRQPFVIAGGSMLNLVLFGEEAISDIDLFSPQPELILKELGVTAQKNGAVYKAGSIDFVEFPQTTDDYVGEIIGAFDFNVTTCAWNGLIDGEMILSASDFFVEAISNGLLELLPHIDPWKSPGRTAHRAGKFMKRLSYNLGPRLEKFIIKYVNDMKFIIKLGRAFESGPPLSYKNIPLSKLRKMAICVNGPSHPLLYLENGSWKNPVGLKT